METVAVIAQLYCQKLVGTSCKLLTPPPRYIVCNRIHCLTLGRRIYSIGSDVVTDSPDRHWSEHLILIDSIAG